tara:strand:- start:129 stop:239 length:111 start_codon:yes stop_codon:yes gene_type:complete
MVRYSGHNAIIAVNVIKVIGTNAFKNASLNICIEKF